jgi:hypothetical protein
MLLLIQEVLLSHFTAPFIEYLSFTAAHLALASFVVQLCCQQTWHYL